MTACTALGWSMFFLSLAGGCLLLGGVLMALGTLWSKR